tara:strand:- start:4930 stop:6249 length:1320 start_codon:yes stop_codon:yes gene_type:complete
LKKKGISKKPKPKIIPRPSHNVSRDEISRSALKVLYRLHKSGYRAFLVGGGVRDALLGLHPKDFDIATDAHPDEVRALFANCRLIGRRFRLAHIRFGREIIEVATFRAAADKAAKIPDVLHDEEGRILRDNVYGKIDEDVWRRDFTCNALYYDISDFSIWDYVGGVEDIRKRKLVMIGNPDRRLREDPVRMLRAVRFAAKLDFEIDETIAISIAKNHQLLSNVPPARLFDEFLKMFQAGNSEKTFSLLRKFDLFKMLFPETDKRIKEDDQFLKFIHAALQNTDDRIDKGQSVTPMFLLGVFLWGPVEKRAERLQVKENMSVIQALTVASYEISGLQQAHISIPRRFTMPMREMLAMQPRFEKRRGKRALRLLDHRRFRAAYDFMMLRARCSEVDTDIADFWTEVQKQTADQRRVSFAVQRQARSGKSRHPHWRRKSRVN